MPIIQLPNESLINIIRSQREKESKLHLMHVMAIVETLKHNHTAQEQCYDKLVQIYENMLIPSNSHSWEPTEQCTCVHIVLGESFAGSMKIALHELGREHSDKLIWLRDNFAYGPLWNYHEKEGLLRRYEWLNDHINPGSDDDRDSIFRSTEYVNQQLEMIPAHASIYVWAAHNDVQEQCGLTYVMHMLRNKTNKVLLGDAVEAARQLFNQPIKRYDWNHSGELSADKLRPVLEHSLTYTPLEAETRRDLEQKWLVLAEQTGNLRVLQGGQVINVSENYYDPYLLETIENMHQKQRSRDFIQSARVIGEAIGYADHHICDSYLEYRLRELIYSGKLEIKGIPRAMRYYSVKKMSE